MTSRVSARFSKIEGSERGPDETAKFLLRWPTKCLLHDEPIVSFCVDHDDLVCNVCILSSHNQCKTIMGLAEAAKGIRGSRECALTDTSIKKLKQKYEKARKEQTEVLESLIEQEKEFDTAVQTFRYEINAVLERLENAVKAKKDDFCILKKESLRGCQRACKRAATMLENHREELNRSYLNPDEQQLFLSTKKSKTVIKKYEEQLSRINQLPKSVKLQFQPNSMIDKFFLNLKVFGTLKLDQSSQDELLPRINRSQEQRKGVFLTSEVTNLRAGTELANNRGVGILPNADTIVEKRNNVTRFKTRKPVAIGQVSVHLEDDNEVPFITGATFMPDDRIVLADDTNKSVKLFSSAFKPISMVKTTASPRDVTPVNSTQVVVTIPSEKNLQFMELGKPIILQKKLPLDIECSGITFHANELYVTSGFSVDREVQIVSLNGEVRKRIRPGIADLRYPLYVTVDPKYRTIFITDYNHGIVGLDLNTGNVTFKCKNTDVHSYYKGITIGNKGNIYVCTWSLHGVSRVHLDGRGLETIISMPDKEGRKPHSIAFSRKSGQIIVSLCGGKSGTLAVYKFL